MELEQITKSVKAKVLTATTEQVEQVISEMGYTPDQIPPNMVDLIATSVKEKFGKIEGGLAKLPIAATDNSQSIAPRTSSNPVSTRKSGGKKKNEPAKTAISTQTKKVDEGFVNVDRKIDQIEGYLNHQSEQSSDRLADVLNNAPDRFFQLVEEKVGAIEIDTTQFDKFNADIDGMLEGFRNARAARSQA